ncbi:MAG: penicillin-binding protein 2 [Verrucomicrobiota bacterium]
MLIFDQLKKSDPPLRLLSICVLAGVGILIAGLWYVQIVSYQRYEESLRTQSLRTVRLPGVRGKILDRNGNVLAENRPGYNVNVYLEELRPYFQSEYLEAKKRLKAKTLAERTTAGKVARYTVVSNLVYSVGGVVRVPLTLQDTNFHKHFNERIWLPLPVMQNLAPEQVARFAESAANLPGVDLEVQSVRYYPHKTTAAHILGYLTAYEPSEDEEELRYNYRLPEFQGKVGVEATFDEELRGSPGAKNMLVNNLGYRQSESLIEPAQPGRNIVLTIDLEVQKAAEKALAGAKADAHGAVVVLDVNTGDIIALASAPTFDPNVFVPRITPDEYSKLNDPATKPMFNRASFGVYQPGSIFKIVVGLAALERGTLRPHDKFTSTGYYQLTPRSRPINDTAPAGIYDFERAFYLSSNSYFIEHGLRSGLDSILAMGKRFCLGEKTGIPTRQDLAGYFAEPGTDRKYLGGPWLAGDTANLCIGQGEIMVTPLQMAVMTAAVANGGKVLRPRLVDRLEPADPYSGEAVIRLPPAEVRSELGVSPRNLQIVRDAMLADVEHSDGSGRPAHVDGFRVCGKTGTAENKIGNTLQHKTTWFASYGPYEKPRYAVLVMVERGVSGGKTCAPVAKKIYEALVAMEKRPPGQPILATMQR